MSGKVLILETKGGDYGAYFVTRGFTKLLGSENVRMWPYKHTNERGTDHYPERYVNGQVLQIQNGKVGYGRSFVWNELWTDKLFWRFWNPEKNIPGTQLPSDGPINHTEKLNVPYASDDEIFAMITNNEFELIVLNGCRWHGAAALSELKANFSNSLPPIVMCDHDDYTQRRWDFYDAFNPLIYFKRSYIRGGHPNDNTFGNRPNAIVKPLPFSSMWDVEWVPWNQRDIDVFCVFGSTQVMRTKFKEVTLEITKQFPNLRVMAAIGHPMTHPEYLTTLSRAKIVIDQQSYGTDTLRFWEASSSGCCLISDFNIHTPPEEIVPETHYYKFDNDISPSGNNQNFVRFRSELTKAIQNDTETEKRARALYDNVRKYHTNAAHAQYIINSVRECGIKLEKLP